MSSSQYYSYEVDSHFIINSSSDNLVLGKSRKKHYPLTDFDLQTLKMPPVTFIENVFNPLFTAAGANRKEPIVCELFTFGLYLNS